MSGDTTLKEKTHVYEPLKRNLPEIDWQRIENVVGTGVPDINGCANGIEFWIEAKIGTSGAFEIRPAQIAWLTRRYNRGGRVFVAVRERDTLSIYKPDGAGKFTLIGTTEKPFEYAWLKDIFLNHKMK